MRNNSTIARDWGCYPVVMCAAVLAACSTDPDPDPGEAWRRQSSQPQARLAVVDDSPVAVSVALDGYFAAAPSPLVEVSRQAVVERDRLVVALGRRAAACVDGATEQAFAGANPDLAGSFLACPDRDAVEQVLVGRVDFALLGGSLSAREMHAGLRQTRIGVELFALAVAPDFPARSLTRAQVRQVLTGQVTDWQQLGYDRGPVVAVVPADRELADRAAEALILGDAFAAGAVRVASERHVADQILRNRGAIGVVRVTGHPLEAEQRLLQIDWITPSLETFTYGTYPFGMPVHVVTSGQPADTALRFLQFARSEGGASLFGRTLSLQP